MGPNERNRRLYEALLRIREDPEDPSLWEAWSVEASDLVGMVFSERFFALAASNDAEDLRQEALCEMHRIRFKLARKTAELGPEAMFRVIYSVARFSMLREYNRLRRQMRYGNTVDPVIHVSMDDPSMDVDLSVPGHADEVETAAVERFARERIPEEIERAVDRCNAMSSPEESRPVRFVVFQRLRGRFVSPALVREVWGVVDPFRIVRYADTLARRAVLAVADDRSLRVGVHPKG